MEPYPISGLDLGTDQPEYYYTQNGTSYRGNYQGSGADYLTRGSVITQSYRSNRHIGDNAPEALYSDTSGSQVEFQKELREDPVDDSSRAFLKYGYSSYDRGHEFKTTRTEYGWGPTRASLSASGIYGNLTYLGYVGAVTSPSLPDITFPSESISIDDGSKLFRAAKPTKAEAGMVQFFAELKQKMPELPGGTILKGYTGVTPKTAGGEYLNLEFGWRPTISDLQKLAKSVLHVGKLTKQYRRDSGHNVRRRRHLPSVSYVIEQPDTNNMPHMGTFFSIPMADYFYVNDAALSRTSVTDVIHTEAWFSGAFTYLCAEGHSFLGKMDEYEALANHLLGIRFDSSTVWELAPFSWLVDWKWDVGNFLSNVTALESDELVMRYGYVMHSTSATRTYLKTGLHPRGSAPGSLRTDVTWSQKTRYRASPYGFGSQGGVSTPRQWAILSALGMTLGSGSLRH
jgi:hypothetical protein